MVEIEELSKRGTEDLPVAWGEYSARPDDMPVSVAYDSNTNPKGLGAFANKWETDFPHILKVAQRKGLDVVAIAQSHGMEIRIGRKMIWGLGGAAIVLGMGGLIIWPRVREKLRERKSPK